MKKALEAAAMASDNENKVKTEADEKFKDVTIERRGEKIVLPEDMSINEGIKWLMRRKDEDERQIAIDESFDAHPFEGALALTKALSKKFGFASLIPTPGFFGPTPPVLVSLETGIAKDGTTETVQVPWGRMQIPGIEGFLETGINGKDNRPVFTLQGQVKQKHKYIVAEITRLIRHFLKEESIYRGKAFRANFPDPRDRPSLQDFCPKFIDTRDVKVGELVFSEEVNRQIETSIFTPIERTAECREFGIPLKRGVLLEGPYGVGKTLTAYVTAKKCEQNGWTFIYLSSVSELERAISFAKQYQPAVIFAEDLDQVLKSEERDEQVNGILNSIDGVESKNSEVVVVLTTNNILDITQAMLRPGRLDAVISVKAPDAAAAQRLVQLYARGLLDKDEDLSLVGQRLEGQIPAVIREVVERSKLAAIRHVKKGEPLRLRGDDLVTAAEGMLNHLQLLQPKPEDIRSDLEKMGSAIGFALTEAMEGSKSAVTRYLHTKEGTTPASTSGNSGNSGKTSKQLPKGADKAAD